jgi:hypothetical protein
MADRMNPRLRTALTHVASIFGSAVATAMFLSTKSVDLYAILDQVNTVVADVAKLAAMVSAIAGPAIALWKSTTKEKILDVAADPNAPKVAREIPPTPEVVAVANALKLPT